MMECNSRIDKMPLNIYSHISGNKMTLLTNRLLIFSVVSLETK